MSRVPLLACLFTFACGGLTDASTDGGLSKEQQLGNSLPSWCREICVKLVQCAAQSSQSKCESDCKQDVASEFLDQGDACAQLGLDFMNCVSGSSCDVLQQNQAPNCVPDSSAIDSVCSGDSGSSTSTPPAASNDSTSPGAPSPGVTCSSGAHMVAANATAGTMVCDSEATDCSDGHGYRVICYYQSSGTESCTCYQDDSSPGAFENSGTSCPSVDVINSMCGWNLSRM
jgi:hypothetical protein